jgi:hypothetical protein
MLLDRPVATLDSVLASAWSALLHAGSAECPICHGEMTPRPTATSAVAAGGQGARRVHGRCSDCGTTLE